MLAGIAGMDFSCHHAAVPHPTNPQSKAGVENKDYKAQRALLAKVDEGEIALEDLRARSRELFESEFTSVR